MSNYTLLRADRTTHLKIIVVSLLAGLLVIGVGASARAPGTAPLSFGENGGYSFKAGQQVNWSARETATIR